LEAGFPQANDDIGIGPGPSGTTRGQDGAVFTTNRGDLLVWDEQPAIDTGDVHSTPAAFSWAFAGAARPAGPVAVAVGPNARPWVIGTNGAIFTAVR